MGQMFDQGMEAKRVAARRQAHAQALPADPLASCDDLCHRCASPAASYRSINAMKVSSEGWRSRGVVTGMAGSVLALVVVARAAADLEVPWGAWAARGGDAQVLANLEDGVEDVDALFSSGASVAPGPSHGPDAMKVGWCRVAFNYFTSDAEVEYIIRAVCQVAEHGWKLLPQYQYDKNNGLHTHRESGGACGHDAVPLSLAALLPNARGDKAAPGAAGAGGHGAAAAPAYDELLARALETYEAAPEWVADHVRARVSAPGCCGTVGLTWTRVCAGVVARAGE